MLGHGVTFLLTGIDNIKSLLSLSCGKPDAQVDLIIGHVIMTFSDNIWVGFYIVDTSLTCNRVLLIEYRPSD